MGLKGKSLPQIRRIRTSMMVLALIVQPLYGLIQSSTAYAVTNPTVNPNSLSGWQVVDDTGNGGSINFVNTLGSSGSGSAQFRLPDTNQSQSLRTSSYGTVKLSDITTLGYMSNVQAGSTAAPSLQFAIDKDITDGDANATGRLIYSPYENGQVVQGQWQYQNARDGLWWSSSPADFGLMCSQLNPCDLNTVITLYPNAGIASEGGVSLTVSNGGGEASVSHVDTLTFNDDTYNFEAIAAPQLTSPALDSTLNDSTFVATWQAVPAASQYVYQSYNDEAATQLRVSEATTGTQKSEADIASGTALWWRVKTIDQQGNEGAWSELRKVNIELDSGEEGSIPVGGIVSGSDSGQTQELLTQLARLNEPFVGPESIDVFVTPSVLSAIETAGDNTDIQRNIQAKGSPMTDQGVKTIAAAPSENGWKFFGILWYWWVLPVIILTALAMRTISRRPTRNFLYSSEQI